MKYEVRIFGKTHIVEFARHGDGWQARLDGESGIADVVEIAPDTLSVLLSGRSYEVCVTPSGGGQLQLQTDGLEFNAEVIEDRKSTRLNSSHITISYAVFCLKKK